MMIDYCRSLRAPTTERTANQKYLTEIVHDNLIWIHPHTAERLGVVSGDLVELTTYRPLSSDRGDRAFRGTGEPIGSQQVRVVVTEGIHPRVVAISNSLAHVVSARAAMARQGPRAPEAALDHKAYGPTPERDDLRDHLWWDKRLGGRSNGVNVNALQPINPEPLIVNQAWFDTVCSLRRVQGQSV